MSQANFTPISLYYSTTASAVPTAANLVPGELAINTNDGKLYYEDSSGVVQVLATKSTGSIGGSNTQVQFNNSGSLGGSSSFTWDGTTVTATKFAGALNGTVGATTASTGAFTTLSTSSTTTLSGLTASTALALDASKNVVSVTNTGTGNNVLSASPTLTGTIAGASLSLSSLTSGRVTYAGASGLLQDNSSFTYGTGLTVNGISQVFQTGLFSTDGTLSNYSVNNGVYLNGNATGWSQLSGDGTRATFVRVWGSGASPANFIVLNTAGSERMRVDSSGNVGIGTSSPANLLHVNGSNSIARFSGASTALSVYQTFFNNSAAQAYFGIESSTGSGIIGSGAAYGMILTTASTNPLVFGTNGTERARIDSSGNLLQNITTYPFGGSNRFVSKSATTTTQQIYAMCSANDSSTYIGNNGTVGVVGTTYGSTGSYLPLTFYTSDAERMRISSAGLVGIGTSSPSTILDISTTDSYSGIKVNAANGGAISFYQPNSNASAKNWKIFTNYEAWGTLDFQRSTSSTNDPSVTAMSISGSGIVTMSAYGAGAATFSASGVISSVSDETWKTKDGVPTNTDAMLQKLEPGYWFYNEEKAPTFGEERQLGFYAQNVHEAIGEEAAPTPQEGKPWGYHDRSVLAIAVMSLKNALNTIEELKQRIETLENK